MEFTLEKELQARIFLHKVAIIKSTIAHAYISKEKAKGGLIISEPCLEDNAMEFANITMQHVLAKGELDEAYDKAWEEVKNSLPDNFCIMR